MFDAKMGDSYDGAGLHYIPPNHKYSLIMMHGLGDTANGWADLAMLLRRRQGVFAETKYILPTAATRPITINGGFPMPGWSDIKGLDPNSPEDMAGFEESRRRIEAIIEGEVAKGIPANRIVLFGFSQGGGLAYWTGFQYKASLGGIVVCSGWVPFSSEFPDRLTEAAKVVPILHCHGTADDVVQTQWGAKSVAFLQTLGLSVQHKTYPHMGHSACQDELDDVGDFLEEIFKKDS